MALKFYTNYLNNVAVPPKQEWSDNYQAALDDFWDNTNTVETIQAQRAVGSKDFDEESVQLTSTAIGNTGTHIGDFWRKIIHKNFRTATNYLGKYYLIDGKYWLTVNTNTVVGAVKDSVIRFCNQTLKWIDKAGVLHEWACVLDDNKLTYTNFDTGEKDVYQIAADMVMLVQQNEETKLIPINQRFVFDGKTYQVKQINPHVSPTYLMIYLNAAQVQQGDDTINDVANASIIAPLNDGLRILPQIYKISQSDTQEYSVYEYKNGEPTDTEFDISAVYDSSRAIFTVIDGNHFSVTNIAETTQPVVVTCSTALTKLGAPQIGIEGDTLIIECADFAAENFVVYVDDEAKATVPNPAHVPQPAPQTQTVSLTITLGGAY